MSSNLTYTIRNTFDKPLQNYMYRIHTLYIIKYYDAFIPV